MLDSALVWFRRDLRAHDHAALSRALTGARRVWCAFVFDREILDALPSRRDRRVEFIWHSVRELDARLRALAGKAGAPGGGLMVLHGRARECIPALAQRLGVQAVFANRDYEPAAIDRDAEVARRLATVGIAFHDSKDQVIFERGEVLTQSGRPFSVFTPYRRAWLQRLALAHLQAFPVEGQGAALAPPPPGFDLPPLDALGFATGVLPASLPTGVTGAEALWADFRQRIDHYHETRDYPAVKGPSYLSVHLRFGTVSIRELVAYAHSRTGKGAQSWLTELIWREFYFMILAHHPRVVDAAFRPAFDAVVWEEDEAGLQAWCAGRTGYPLVDAAMRQLNTTGYMHNRLRMVTASFLTKDLGIDWRRGERYFAARLNDYDLAANNGGWQWAASTGCDAQPWFRLFNPVTQSERFDPGGRFIRRYVPELGACPDRAIHAPWRMSVSEQIAAGCLIGRDYPAPIVDHASARERTLARFAALRPGSLPAAD